MLVVVVDLIIGRIYGLKTIDAVGASMFGKSRGDIIQAIEGSSLFSREFRNNGRRTIDSVKKLKNIGGAAGGFPPDFQIPACPNKFKASKYVAINIYLIGGILNNVHSEKDEICNLVAKIALGLEVGSYELVAVNRVRAYRARSIICYDPLGYDGSMPEVVVESDNRPVRTNGRALVWSSGFGGRTHR